MTRLHRSGPRAPRPGERRSVGRGSGIEQSVPSCLLVGALAFVLVARKGDNLVTACTTQTPSRPCGSHCGAGFRRGFLSLAGRSASYGSEGNAYLRLWRIFIGPGKGPEAKRRPEQRLGLAAAGSPPHFRTARGVRVQPLEPKLARRGFQLP